MNFYKVKILTTFDDIKSLTLKIIHGLIIREENKFKNNANIISNYINNILKNKNFVKSVLVLAIEIVLFIENSEELSFNKISESIELSLYDFWKIINPFLNFAVFIHLLSDYILQKLKYNYLHLCYGKVELSF